MNTFETYTIYSHADTDGGIAAALFHSFLKKKYPYLKKIHIVPVNHGIGANDWSLKEISWPCAILDFTLHHYFLNNKFFSTQYELETSKQSNIPDCYWIDHHTTGANLHFINEKNIQTFIKNFVCLWDTKAVSTPGLIRTHRNELNFPDELIKTYEEFIDIADIVDGALYPNCESAHDFDSFEVQVQSLFTSSYPAINYDAFYTRLVNKIIKHPKVEDFLDSDPLFKSLIEFERMRHIKKMKAYEKNSNRHGDIVISNFSSKHSQFKGLGRFIPYLLHKDAKYAIHIFPARNGLCSVSCGLNPWNKENLDGEKHIGEYFSKYLRGGGHAFVGGGKLSMANFKSSLDHLLRFLSGHS
jgi:oligoribonuclease NrnB/cAMP/cGMP phosphodiesterase (DHH superfamily)